MRQACRYAIVRFMPFIEIGEFANVGIVLHCPESGFFNFKLSDRHQRLTAFFENMEAGIYVEARKFFELELVRIKTLIESGALDQAGEIDIKAGYSLFDELLRPRETMIRFDAPRAVLTDNPQVKLEELYGFYVERKLIV